MKPSGRIDRKRVEGWLAECETLLSRPELLDATAIFRERAQRFAERIRATTIDSSEPVLVWQLAGERFGLELSRVAQVFGDVPITPVPGAAAYCLGVANLQGSVRSVVDLRPLMNIPAEETGGGYVVLLRADRALIGLWVESLDGVRHLAIDELKMADESDFAGYTQFAKGITPDRLVVLDADAVLSQLLQPNVATAAAT